MKSLLLIIAGYFIMCKSLALATSDDDVNLMSNSVKTFALPEPDVEKLTFEPYGKFFELRKDPEFPKEINDDEIDRKKRDNKDKSLLSEFSNKISNKNKMDEKIKEVPENSKFHGFQFLDD